MPEPNYIILLVDDDPDILEFLQYNLEKEGFGILVAHNGFEALQIAKEHIPHLILLDVMMPEMNGIETCRELRKIDSLRNSVIAFLTAKGEDVTQIEGFESGGDDFVVKPIKPKVLISRIKALLKRTEVTRESNIIIEAGNLKINLESYIVSKNDQHHVLPKKEFDLLCLLISKPGKVFGREEILSKVWGNDVIVGDRTIDVHVRKLREKFGDDTIRTVKGFGYKFEN